MLIRKLLRDMWRNKAQFFSILILSFLAIYINAGMNAEWRGMQKVFDDYIEETNFTDIWVYGNDFKKQDIKNVEKIEGVNKAERKYVVDAIADLKGSPTLRLNFVESNDISKCHTIRGEDFSSDKEGIWINNFFADERKLSVGDTLKLTFSNTTIEEKIKGIIINPEYIYTIKDSTKLLPDNKDFGFAYLSSNELGKKFFNQLIIDVKDTAKYDSIQKKIEDKLNDKGLVFQTRNSQMSYVTYSGEVKESRSFGEAFPIILVLISILAIVTAMTRITAKQRTLIGTLKALGFKNSKITFHYVSYGIWLSALGAILGVILGPLTIPGAIFKSYKTYYALPQWKAKLSYEAIIMTVIIILVSTITCYFACHRQLSDPLSETLKPQCPKVKKVGKLQQSRLWQRLGFAAQWNLRDIFRNKIRTLMGIVSVASCMMLLVCAFAINDSVSDIKSWIYKELYLFESKILVSNSSTLDRIKEIKNKYDGQLIYEQGIEVAGDMEKKTATLTVIDEGNLLKYQNAEGKDISIGESEIALSNSLASHLSVDVGDKISWRIIGSDKWEKVTVGKLYRTPTNQGISMTANTYENLGYKFKPSAVLSPKKVDVNLKDNDITAVQSRELMLESLEGQMTFVYSIVGVLVFGAVMIGIIMIYNLGVISFNEKIRDMAVLKMLGFKVKKLRWILQMQNIWITLVGIIIGIPLGRWITSYVFTTIRKSIDMRITITVLSWIISVLGTLILSMIINFVLSCKVKRIDMVESLKELDKAY